MLSPVVGCAWPALGARHVNRVAHGRLHPWRAGLAFSHISPNRGRRCLAATLGETYWRALCGTATMDGKSVLPSREATHDINRTPSQTVDVVPDGPHQMDERMAGQQSLQSWAVESGEKCALQDFFPTHPLAGSGEVFQVLGFGMHDVAVGRSRCEDGILRPRRQSVAAPVFRLTFRLSPWRISS